MQSGILAQLKKITQNKYFPVYFVILVTYFLLGLRFFYFIYKYTANILYWDQWDIVELILGKNYFFDLFIQHNEHKFAVGLFFINLIAKFTNWNDRAETIFIGLLIFASSLIALALKKKLFGKLDFTDVIIPFIFLNLFQWENLTWGFQIGFTLPLFFALISFYFYTIRYSSLRNLSLIFLVFLSTYSHFHGIFLGIITGIFFAIEAFLSKKTRLTNLLLCSASVLISLSYFLNYKQVTYLGSKSFQLLDHLKFIIIEINSFIGFKPSDYQTYSNLKLFIISLLLLIIPIIFLIIFVHFLRKVQNIERMKNYFPIFALIILSLLFAFSTAYGRVGLGLDYANSSRYTTFMIPIYLGIYFCFLTTKKTKYYNMLTLIIIGSFVIISSQNSDINYKMVSNRLNNLNAWKTCYLQKFDIPYCNQKTSFLVYPGVNPQSLKSRLDLLEKDKLNLFEK